MHAERVFWGGLNTVVLRTAEPTRPPTAAVVLCHGFGAPASDLIALGPALMQLQPELAKDVLWAFPAAPIDLEEAGMAGGRAWWPIDMARLLLAINRGQLRELRYESPPGLPAAREAFLNLLAELKAQTGIANDRLVLGGFSQGAMITTDVALRLDSPPAGLCILSGTLLCESEWKPLIESRGELSVFQSHGMSDPILPFENAEALHQLFIEAGASLDFVPFQGEHAIPPLVLKKLSGFLKRILQAE